MPLRILLVFTVLILFPFYADSQVLSETVTINDSTLNGTDIDLLLEDTENIRNKNFKDFVNNLRILDSNKSVFTDIQRCHFEFLESYRIAFQGQIDDSVTKLQTLYKQCQFINIQIRIKSLLANIYGISGKYYDSILNLDFVVSHIEQLQDKNTRHIAYITATIVYDLIDQWELGLKFADLLIQDHPEQELLCKAEVYRYRSLLELGKANENTEGIKKTIQYCKDIGEILSAQILNTHWLKVRTYNVIDTIEIQSLLQQLLDANDEIENTKYKNLISMKNSLLALLYAKSGDTDQAVTYAKMVVDKDVSLGLTRQKIDAAQVLIDYYQNKNEYQTANKYLIEKNKAESKLYSDKQSKLIAYQTVKHDNLAKTHQIEYLNQQNKMLKLEKELADESRLNQLLINFVFFGLIVFLLFFGYRFKKQQEKYKLLSEMDHMTQIFNRNGARKFMDYLLPYSKKKSEILAYGIFDLDCFKKINDCYGHLTGDWVIKQSISACQKLNNSKITFARLGGEEFSITIRDSSLQEIIEFCEQCRQSIMAIKTQEGTGYDFQISASFGVTTSELSGYNYSDLMRAADKALYVAKHNGRNQVAVFEKSIDSQHKSI